MVKKIKPQLLNEVGNNLIIGFYEGYALVYAEEEEKFYYYEQEAAENLLYTSVEADLLKPVSDLPDEIQKNIALCWEG